jgi:H+/Cl- antiporter ClcA
VRRTEPDEQITRATLERAAPPRPRRSSRSRVITFPVASVLLALGPNGIRRRTADYTADHTADYTAGHDRPTTRDRGGLRVTRQGRARDPAALPVAVPDGSICDSEPFGPRDASYGPVGEAGIGGGWVEESRGVGVHFMSASSQPSGPPPFTQNREFWVLMGYAVALGVFGAFAGLVFMGVIGFGGRWYADADPGWFGGQWWWVAVTAGAGVLVGLLRRLTRLPEQIPGLIPDLQEGHVDPRLVPGIAVVSAVSLIGGASLGPEKALGSIGGGAGSWIAQRRKLSREDAQLCTLSGFGGAYGGLFSSTVIVVMFILELARPGGHRFAKALVGQIVASSVSFGIYFAIAGAVFLDAYQVPPYAFEDWQLLAGIPLGLLAALVVTLLVVLVQGATRLFALVKPEIVRTTLGGVVFGVIGVALPLTMFTGSAQLKTVLDDAGSLGVGLLVVLVIAKQVTFAVCQASGFVGGPIFPALFIGGTAGVLVHEVLPAVPLGLAFTCLLAAVPGSLAAAPFSMVLLAAFLTQVGALQTAPILIAVVTAFLTMEAVKYVVARRKQARAATGKPATPN